MDLRVLVLSLSVVVVLGFKDDLYCGRLCTCDLGNVHCNTTQIGICIPQLLSEVSANVSSVVIEGGSFHCSEDMLANGKNITNIVDLEIVNSKLYKVDEKILAVLPNLERLILRHNKITCINFSHPERESNLEVLDLSHNAIASFDRDAFQGLISVKELNLSYNKLFSLRNTTVFEKLTFLQTLDLSHNQLTYIHPQTFHSLSSLMTLHLNDNMLQSLQQDVFFNVTLLEHVYLGNNHWDCHCGINWIANEMSRNHTQRRYEDLEDIKCWTPEYYNTTQVAYLNTSDILCESPKYAQNSSYLPEDLQIVYFTTAFLHCQATGYPKPSVYWIGPRGVLIHESQHAWLPTHIDEFSDYQSWFGKPLYLETSVRALANGSLVFQKFRRNYEGEYTCVARNPMGEISTSVNVTVTINISKLVVESVLVGLASCLSAILIGFTIGSSQWIAERTCCKKNKEESAIEHYYSDDVLPPKLEQDEEYWYEYFKKLPYEYPDPTSRQSPRICVTPAEFIDDGENQTTTDDAGVWQVLDDVRSSLRNSLTRQAEWVRSHTQNVRDSGRQLKTDVGRKVERVRYKAHRIRESGSNYVQHIKESSSTTLKTIRVSSGQYALRVRSGVADTVEDVRGRVKSIKEFCGTGDLGQTMSVASVSTNVDSQVQTIDYKSHTLV